MYSNENIYITNNQYRLKSDNIYDSFIKAIKELTERIYSNVENIITHNNEPSSDELIETIKDSFVDTENILSQLNVFEEEYYDFSSIKDMTFYILDNELFNQISMIRSLLKSFYTLVQIKKDASDEEYEEKYEEFSSKLINAEQSFYTEIYEPTENYNEKVLSEMSNSLIE